MNDHGYYKLNQDPILWAMLNAIKEEHGQTLQLKIDHGQLKADNAQLKARVDQLDAEAVAAQS